MRRRRSLLLGGALLVLAGLAVLLAARISIGTSRWVYVSEMGAPDLPTAGAFEAALLLVAAGGALIGAGAWPVRARLLPALRPAGAILLAAACFALASQVTCTAGCPLPVGPAFRWQDLVHTSAAVLGFAAACAAMLQLATVRGRPVLARLSLAAGISVAVVAGTGGILSLLRVWLRLGGTLEFVATAIAVLWLASVGLVLALEDVSVERASRARARGSGPAGLRGPHRATAPARSSRPEDL